jgi:hypothetical protein
VDGGDEMRLGSPAVLADHIDARGGHLQSDTVVPAECERRRDTGGRTNEQEHAVMSVTSRASSAGLGDP